jgi:hypothetical protein
MIDDPATPWQDVLKRMYDAGHQIGSHTWSHQNLNNISPQQRRDQIIYNEMAINNILGVIPTYMRPPYSSCDGECPVLLEQLGYHITYFDLDTEDTVYSGNAAIPKTDFDGNLSFTDRRLVISHDIQPNTANVLTEHMLKGIQAAGLKAVTVGECMNEPPQNWYRLFSGAPFVPPKSWTRFEVAEAPEAPVANPNPLANSSSVANPNSELLVDPLRLSAVPATSSESASFSASSSNHGHSTTGSSAAPSGPSLTSRPQGSPSPLVTGGAAKSAANAICLSQLLALGSWLLFIGAVVVHYS